LIFQKEKNKNAYKNYIIYNNLVKFLTQSWENTLY